jgi:hypothetical protein
MSTEHGESKVPIVPWPSGITSENRAAIERNLTENSLAVAVALVMVEETRPLIQKEFDVLSSLDSRHIFNQPFRDWTSYLRAAHAVLNAESIIKTGEPYEKPGHDFEAVERDGRVSIKDFLLDEDKARELEDQRRVAGQISWFHRELDFAERYKNSDSPLDFVDAVLQQEVDRLREQDKKDKDTVRELHDTFKELHKDEIDEPGEEVVGFIEDIRHADTKKKINTMERGRERFHQLYQDFNH